MTTPESLSGLVILILSLLRSNVIASKHSRCIMKSVKSIWVMQKACARWVSFAFKALMNSLHVLKWWKSYPISTSNSAKIFSLFTKIFSLFTSHHHLMWKERRSLLNLKWYRQQSNPRDRTNFSDCDKTYADKLQILFPEFETERNRCLTNQLTIRKCFVSIWFCFVFFCFCHMSAKFHPIKKCQKFSSFQTHFNKFLKIPDQFFLVFAAFIIYKGSFRCRTWS